MAKSRSNKESVIRARCEPSLKTRIEAYCAKTGLSEADVVRLAVLDYLDKEEDERARRTPRKPHQN